MQLVVDSNEAFALYCVADSKWRTGVGSAEAKRRAKQRFDRTHSALMSALMEAGVDVRNKNWEQAPE